MLPEVMEGLKETVKSPLFAEGRGTAERREGDPEEYFARESSVERYTSRLETQELFPPERKTIQRYFTNPGAAVLDVGCATGRVSHRLDEDGFDVTGTDISEPLVERARSLFPDIDFRVDDIADSSLPSAEFDYVVFPWYGLDYISPESRRIQALHEIHRVLKPGGFFLLSTYNTWYLLPSLVIGDGSDFKDFYLSAKNRSHLFTPYRLERVTDGNIHRYLSNPIRQWIQLWKCGFTPIDIIGEHDNILRLFERNLHLLAKK